MVDMSETKQRITKGLDKGLKGTELNEIAENLESQARMLEEAGRGNEASNLRDWARELRQKSVKTPY